MTSKVEGLEKWERQVRRIPETAKQALRDSQAKNADMLANTMKAIVPVKSGTLRKSIGWTRGLPPQAAGSGPFAIKAGTMTDRQGVLNSEGLFVTVHAGNGEAYYPRWVEFGTKAAVHGETFTDRRGRLRKVKRNHPGTRPRPFFYQVIRNYLKKVKASTASAANRAIKKAVQG